MITAIKEIHRLLNDEQVKLRIRELNWSKFVLDSIVIGMRKQNKMNEASMMVLSRIIALRGIGLFRGEDEPIVDVEELGMDVCLEEVHKRLDLLYQNMKELRGGLEDVREEVTCIGKSVEAANRSVMEVEDELRDIWDDIREKEGRRFCSGNNTTWNEEDDQLGGDVNDDIGVAGNKMVECKIQNEEKKETTNEKFVGSDNEYNDMKIDKDSFSDRNDKLSEGEIGGEDDDPLNLDVTQMETEEVDILRHWKQLASKQKSLRPLNLNKIRET
ncbi:hypothetical protein M9H77_17714 [Catharanthus roseus]|uniref:Uncharacterized protein n=1 Tax=Catharanthus roseus TaxID=4058 RepID=A0ACC0B5E0_CATRO|nr:hypothetical protein M9H77_17714 [Catharanthus roseus]